MKDKMFYKRGIWRTKCYTREVWRTKCYL